MPRAELPYIDYQIHAGLIERVKAESLNGTGLLIAKNVDTFGVYGALGKVPGSSRKSDTAASTWMSLHYFEYFSLLGDLTREVVGLNGSILYKINTDQSLTNLKTGMISEELSSFTTLDRIHLIGPTNDGVKWDGTTLSNWGIHAPGDTDTILEGFDNSANFTINGTNTISTDGAVNHSQDDVASVVVNKIDTTVSTAVLNRTGLGLNVQGAAGVYGSIRAFWLFVPAGGLSKLVTSGTCVEFRLGSTSLTDSNKYNFTIGDLVEGWNEMIFAVATPDSTTGAGATLTNVQELQVTITFTGSGTTQTGFLVDKFFATDNPSPAVALGASGSVDAGDVSYKVTFVSKYGFESNAGVSSLSVTSVGSIISLTNIPVSSDPQVVARRIYRDRDDDSVHELLAQIEDNVTTAYSDNLSDDSRSSITPPLSGDSLIDHSPPERMVQVVYWQGFGFGINADRRFEIDFTSANEPEAWPVENVLQIDEEIVRIEPTYQGMYVFSTDATYVLSGNSADTFRVDKLDPEIGCTGPRAATGIKRICTTWHDDGPYLRTLNDNWYIGTPVKDTIDAIDPRSFRSLFCVHDRLRFRIVFFIQSVFQGTYDTVLSYQYGTNSLGTVSTDGGKDPQDSREGVWTRIGLPSSVRPRCAAIVEQTADKPEIWIGCDDGVVYRLQDPTTADYAKGSLSEAIDADIETSYAKMGNEQDRFALARALAISATTSVQSVWTVTVTTATDAKGSELTTSTFNVTLGAGNVSPVVSIPGENFGSHVKVRLRNNNTGEGGSIRSLRLYYIPRRNRGTRAR